MAAVTPALSAHRPGAVDFLRTLAHLYDRVEVTTRDGRALSLAEGLRQTLAIVTACGEARRKLIFIGNGGSASIASHQAVDYWKNGGLKAMAFNDASLLTCVGNDYGYDRVFAEPIRRFAESGDLVIAISSSGRSPNMLRAAEAAREAGCQLVTCSGFDATNDLRAHGAVNFYVPSHNYGIVEVIHLSLLHGVLDELMTRNTFRAAELSRVNDE